MQKRLFTDLGLSAEMLKAIDKMGFEEASPIQSAALPPALAGRDVIGQSSTGSGKTAAFAIPAIEKVDPHKKVVQVLVLCPTRELAIQVAEEVGKLAAFKRGVHAVPIYGGQSYERQFRALAAGVQIVIGTPGRVMDHLDRGTLKLDGLRIAILDEADRMLDMGFRDDIDRILSATPATRQTLFFSATMPTIIRQLINKFSKEPEWVKIEQHAQNAPQVDQVYYEVERRSKLEVLTRLIDLHDFRYGLIFCSTKIMVDELDEQLHARGYAVDRLHGDITQAQRDRVMEKFRRRGFEFLIATDVAARGLDIDDLEVVFNYDLPNDGEDYTHRIGRTGRAGKTGRAITFVAGRELYKLQSMVRFAQVKIRRESVPSLDQVEEARVNVFFERLRSTLDAGVFVKQDRMVDRLLEQGYPSTDIISALIHLLTKPGESANEKVEKLPAQGKFPMSTPTVTGKPPASAPAFSKSAPLSAKPVFAKAPQPASNGEAEESEASDGPDKRGKYEAPPRTGRDPGMTTLFMNVGRKQLVTPADIVGKIAGVTRLPAQIVGAIDIHQRHLLVDVATEHAELVQTKLTGIRVKGEVLKVTRAASEKPTQ